MTWTLQIWNMLFLLTVLHALKKDDPTGTKYVIEGLAMNGVTEVGVVGRFADSDRYLIITIYEISED